jgi:hypothetical protein
MTSSNWPMEAQLQEDSNAWLQKNSLTSKGLSVDQLLPTLGFKQSQGKLPATSERVTSAYSGDLFVQHPDSKGNIYNVQVKICNFL